MAFMFRAIGLVSRIGAALARSSRSSALVDEGIGDDFMVVAQHEAGAHVRVRALALGHGQGRHGCKRGERRDLVVAMQSGDFLDQVFFDGEIETPARGLGDDHSSVLLHVDEVAPQQGENAIE